MIVDLRQPKNLHSSKSYRTHVTIANPESRAEVLLEAFSLARLRYNFLQERAWTEWWLDVTNSR